jgi:hypothetical protein
MLETLRFNTIRLIPRHGGRAIRAPKCKMCRRWQDRPRTYGHCARPLTMRRISWEHFNLRGTYIHWIYLAATTAVILVVLFGPKGSQACLQESPQLSTGLDTACSDTSDCLHGFETLAIAGAVEFYGRVTTRSTSPRMTMPPADSFLNITNRVPFLAQMRVLWR